MGQNRRPQVMLNGTSSFGDAEDADNSAWRRLVRMTDANPDISRKVMGLQVEGSKIHDLDTSEQGQLSASWNALMSARGPSSGIGTLPCSFPVADDDKDVSEAKRVRRETCGHGVSDVHPYYQFTRQCPGRSANGDISLWPERSSRHHSDRAASVGKPHDPTFKGRFGLVDLRGDTPLPTFDNDKSVVGPAAPLELGVGVGSLPGHVNGHAGPVRALHDECIGVDGDSAYRRETVVSLPNSRDERVAYPHPTVKRAAWASWSGTTSQSSVVPSHYDYEMSRPRSGRRSFFETVLGPTGARELGDNGGVMRVDSEPPPSLWTRSAAGGTERSIAKARGLLSFRTGPSVARTYKIVPATCRPSRREHVSDPVAKPFACTHCTRRYGTEAECDAHLAKHKYPCCICDAVLTDLSTLKAHKTRHAGVRCYSCDCSLPGRVEACGRAFVTFGDLYQHMRQTHGVVPKSQGETTLVHKSAGQL
ncbi:hypothetical protein AURDEDRAFT_158604 [Auricularia subglabra TFB-10046 SS5]|nr:hypothetical protein AURDEDRAFT_158604 [Auricularia subglabra TFB-10046 SS5]